MPTAFARTQGRPQQNNESRWIAKFGWSSQIERAKQFDAIYRTGQIQVVRDTDLRHMFLFRC